MLIALQKPSASHVGDASRMLKAIANENDLTRTTLQHIKGVLSGIFTHAKNEGAFDGANPVRDVHIPGNAREPGETYAYNLNQICRILDSLPLLPKAVVATAAYAGLREGELRGLEWTDYQGDALSGQFGKPLPISRKHGRAQTLSRLFGIWRKS
ncbi:MAG TPA: hypothetical protein VIX37_18200 [Candidatus Sulfotelmatobacter sp.]